MSHSTLLSVILPVYKTEDQLARCLSSLLEQDLAPADYEVIVVDDGSPDGSVGVARGFEERYRNVIIVRQANRGLSAARNAGLDIARGRYLWFVDSDDYVAAAVMAGLTGLMERVASTLWHSVIRQWMREPRAARGAALRLGRDPRGRHGGPAHRKRLVYEGGLGLPVRPRVR